MNPALRILAVLLAAPFILFALPFLILGLVLVSIAGLFLWAAGFPITGSKGDSE